MKKELEDILENLPPSPGVYEFMAFGGVVYVGKSKNLRQRVRSYFQPSQTWKKALRMVPHIEDIVITVTDTHLEAQLLECEKIITHQPVFNNRMKSDKNLAYIVFDENTKECRYTKVYQVGAVGPLGNRRKVYRLLEEIKKLFPITDLKNFQYHVLPEGQTSEERAQSFRVLRKLFTQRSKMDIFIQACEEKMNGASKKLAFEEARYFRDLIHDLQGPYRFLQQRDVFERRDMVFLYPLEQGKKAIYLRKGHLLSTRTFLTEKELNIFLREMKEKSLESSTDKNQKFYTDILYREYLELSREQILEIPH